MPYILPDGITQEKLDALAMRLCMEVDAVENAKAGLSQRWRENERQYYVDASATNLVLVEGMPPYAIPTQRTKADRLIGSTVVACTSVEPWVQVIDSTAEAINVSDIETSLMAIARDCGFVPCFSQALRNAFISNIGAFRVVPDVDDNNQVNGRVLFDWIEPQDFMAFPIEIEDLKRAKTMGHRTGEQVWEIRQKQAVGLYLDFPISGYDQPRPSTYTESSYDKSENTDPVSDDDGYVEEWDLYPMVEVGKGRYQRFRVILAYSDQKILHIEPYLYSRPPYPIAKFVRSEKRIFCNDSVAQIIQGLCKLLNDLTTGGIQGTLSTAMPMTFVIGGLRGKGKALTIRPGDINYLDQGSDVKTIKLDFDLQKLVVFMQLIEPWIDGAIGISRISSSQELPAETKATTVRAMVNADSQKQDQYLEIATVSLVDAFELMYEYMGAHFDAFKAAYGNLIPLQDDSFLAKRYRFKATAMSVSSQDALLQKLQAMAGMAMQPTSGLDYSKVEIAIIENMDMPFDVRSLQKDGVTMVNMFVQMCQKLGIPVEAVLSQAAQIVDQQKQAHDAGAALGAMPDSHLPQLPQGSGPMPQNPLTETNGQPPLSSSQGNDGVPGMANPYPVLDGTGPDRPEKTSRSKRAGLSPAARRKSYGQ